MHIKQRREIRMTYDDWKTESPEEEYDRENPPKRRSRADFLMDEADYLRDRDHESQAMTGQLVAEDEDDFDRHNTERF